MKQLFIDAWNFFKKNKLRVLFYAVMLVFIYNLSYDLWIKTYLKGYGNGLKRGYNIALDTVNSIMNQQLRSDTSHCTYIIIDTSYYILHHK